MKAQDGLIEDKGWIKDFKEICLSFSPFELTLAAPAKFANAVVYFSVQSAQLVELHRRLVESAAPTEEQIKRYSELELYVPHLTLGQTRWGMTEAELNEMFLEAAQVFVPHQKFTASGIRIYQEIEIDNYVPYEDISLKGS